MPGALSLRHPFMLGNAPMNEFDEAQRSILVAS
jgi:hypothetical protein